MRIVRSFLCARLRSAICVAGLVLLVSGCEPHNQLTNQIAEVRIELDEVQRSIGQTEAEMSRLTKDENELRGMLPLRLGSETTVRKNNAMRVEIELLKRRKTELETFLPQFKADFESYCKKYL